jgi:spore maturation protein CgeB
MKTTSITPRTKAPKNQSRSTTRLNVEFMREPDFALPVNGRAEFMNRINAASLGRAKLKIVCLVSSIGTSGTTAEAYRALMRELSGRGHDVVFMEPKQFPESSNGVMSQTRGKVVKYESLAELKHRHGEEIRNADTVVLSSDLPAGKAVCEWVLQKAGGAVAFHDLDAPATLARLEAGDGALADVLRRFDLYLPRTGGPELHSLEKSLGTTMIRPFYAAVDTTIYYPDDSKEQFNLGYIGDYAEEMQPAVDELLLEPARNWEDGSFIVSGSGYPREIRWPRNIKRRPQLTPTQKRSFYCSQKFALSISTEAMTERGHTPALSLFEAAACGTPIISEYWDGIESFFEPQDEILVTHSSEETLYYLLETTEAERTLLSKRARARVLSSHTAKHRAAELEMHICDVLRPTITSRAPAV